MGFVYKYTNKLSGKWYIGSHNGNNPKYTGSGILFARAIKKYGLDSFSKEILYEGADYREQEERILKELNASEDPMSYNLKNEALGGSFPGPKNGMWGKKLSELQKAACGSAFRGKTRPDHSEKMKGTNNPMFGKSEHTHGLKEYGKSREGKTLEEIHGKERAAKIRQKLSESQKMKKHKLEKVKCPHCGMEGSGPNMSRYHFHKCKSLKP